MYLCTAVKSVQVDIICKIWISMQYIFNRYTYPKISNIVQHFSGLQTIYSGRSSVHCFPHITITLLELHWNVKMSSKSNNPLYVQQQKMCGCIMLWVCHSCRLSVDITGTGNNHHPNCTKSLPRRPPLPVIV